MLLDYKADCHQKRYTFILSPPVKIIFARASNRLCVNVVGLKAAIETITKPRPRPLAQ